MLARYIREVNFHVYPVVEAVVTVEVTNPALDENCNERPVIVDYPVPLSSWPDSSQLNNTNSISQSSSSFTLQDHGPITLITLITLCVVCYLTAAIIFYMDPALQDFNLRLAFIFVTTLAVISCFGLWYIMYVTLRQRQSYNL